MFKHLMFFLTINTFIIFTSSFAGIIYVPNDTTSIQGGIHLASNGDTVLVADSTYYENINFKGKAITVASMFIIDGDTNHINNTIIDGSQPSHPDSGSVVSFLSGEDTTSILCGFTITGGTGTRSTQFGARAGGGILCYFSGGRIASNKIINNTINDNSLFTAGGGFCGIPYGNNSYVILEKNKISANEVTCTGNFAFGGGVAVTCYGRLIDNEISYNTCTSTYSEANGGGIKINPEIGSPRFVLIKGNRIIHNIAKGLQSGGHDGAKGGGIVNHYGKVHILENNISFNQLDVFGSGNAYGAGISMRSANNESLISSNYISNNTIAETIPGGGGGISVQNGGVPIINNIICGNSVQRGGGIYLSNSSEEIINNTIVSNTAFAQGGGLYSQVSNPIIINDILWGNFAPNGPQITTVGINLNAFYSDIQDSVWQGIGNISADPQFADTLIYELSDSSPCIGAGIDSIQIGGTWYYAPPTDFDGDPRPIPDTTMPDIGAQEDSLGSSITRIKDFHNSTPEKYNLFPNYPNPFNPSTTIEFDLPKTTEVTLKVYNILGEEVATPVSEKMSAGSYSYEWNASKLASGIYLYKLQAGDYVETRKMILMK